MKSRTSFFNGTVFKKDVTRFAPVWALFSVLLLLCLVPIVREGGDYSRASAISNAASVSGLLAFLYAPLVAQLLFGDLYNARMCNALHALPLRRECWFGTHVIAGLAFAFVPYAVISLLGLPILDLGVAWTAVPLWLLAACLQYLFFFALSVFCAMIVGNRFSQVIVYGILNFFSLLVFWMADSLYEPLLTGIRIPEDPFTLFSPLIYLMDGSDFITINVESLLDSQGYFSDYKVLGVAMGGGWGYLAVCALIAVALLLAALILYRKRDLECAGDFIAFRFMEPVFLVFFTFTAGIFCQLFTDIFGLSGAEYLFLAVGLIAGFFTGLMMLRRTTRVFRPRAFLGFGVLVAVFVLSLLITALDPFGITRRVPDAEDVVSVNVSDRHELYYPTNRELTVTDPADIEKLIQIHEAAIGGDAWESAETGEGVYGVRFCVEYTLSNGSTFARFYQIDSASPSADVLKEFYTRFECVMGFPEEQIPEMVKKINHVSTDQMPANIEEIMENLDAEGLLNAIAADCAAGNMAQFSAFHLGPGDGEGGIRVEHSTYLEISFIIGPGRGYDAINWRSLYIYDSCTNTLQWLKENGLYDPGLAGEYFVE